MTVIKRDFVPENTKSYYYTRPLSSGKAYFLEDANGKIFYASKNYIDEHLKVDLSKIPDFTISLISMRSYENSRNRSCSKNKTHINYDKSYAIAYITLREEKLIEYKNISYEPLKNYYDKYMRDRDLADEDIKRIINIEQS
ncbi:MULTISPECIES: hypothetical protein [Campylobacter]|uniref:Uncharacterized protein n=2 Tax=Campylobacter porcelli TaxID=1660073 RepID=A0ABU7M6F1_9BACT|nr:hypothetical protein [Campylobacter sp. P0124]MCR8697148.1 hypothetical protein [Campylobacter sp. RM19073]MEE3745261.1 hypothetical protein [Campylobacter sp. CX2-4855-23]